MPVGGTAFFGMNQHPRITTTYLNQLHRRGDPAPGLNVGGETDFVNGGQVGFSGMIAQPYAGFNGGKLTITDPWAKQFADPAVGPLYGGIYQYLRLDPSSTQPIRGQIVFWLDELNYSVTTDGSVGASKIAGVAVNETEPGRWDFFQIAGIANVWFTSAVDQGDQLQVDTSTGFVEEASTFTPLSVGIVVLTDAVANELNPVQLNFMVGYNF